MPDDPKPETPTIAETLGFDLQKEINKAAWKIRYQIRKELEKQVPKAALALFFASVVGAVVVVLIFEYAIRRR
jgi:hypothetical protein